MDRSRFCSASRRVALVAAPILIAGGLAYAQAPDQPPPPTDSIEKARADIAKRLEEREERVRTTRQETSVVYPYGLSGTAFNAASLVASKDSKTVAITTSFATSRLSELVVQAAAPLSEDEPRTVTLQLDGLANKAKAHLEWRYGQQRLPSHDAMAALTDKLWSTCRRPSTAESAGDTGIAVEGCSLDKLPGAESLIEQYFPRHQAWYLSVKGSASPETFKFTDSTTFAEGKATRWSYSGALIFGYLTRNNVYLAASGRLERSYKASDKQAVCTVASTTETTTCPNKVVGEPSGKTLAITEVELRRYLPSIGGLTFGMAGILRRDWRQHNTTVEVPLYFVKDKDGGLTGGVSGGYVWSPDRDSRGARFTVFVGQAFRLGQ